MLTHRYRLAGSLYALVIGALSFVSSSALAQDERIVFAAKPHGSATYSQIVSVRPDGSVAQILADALVDVYNPRISPDGTRISYQARGWGGNLQLWVMNSDGGSRRELTQVNHQYGPHNWAWLDNNRVIYRWAPSAAQGDARILNVDSGEDSLLLSASSLNKASIDYLDISADRTRLIIAAQDGSWSPTLDLFKVDLIDGTPTSQIPFVADAHYIDESPVFRNNEVVYWSKGHQSGLASDREVYAKLVESVAPIEAADWQERDTDGNAARCVAVSPDNMYLLLRLQGGTLVRRSLVTGEEVVAWSVATATAGDADWGVLYPQVCKADSNGDGSVTVSDIFHFLANWFAGCP